MSLRSEGRFWTRYPRPGADDNATNFEVLLDFSPVKLEGAGDYLKVHTIMSEESTDEDRQSVYELAKGAKYAIDVGSFNGSSAHAILSNESVEQCLCIDHFMGNRAYNEKGELSGNTAKTPGWMAFFALHHRLMEFNGRYRIWCGPSQHLIPILQDEIADFIFIDAAHHYRAVKDDIALWLPKLKPGGILAGHDYDKHIKDEPDEWLKKYVIHEVATYEMDGEKYGVHPGVVLAVRESFEKFELSKYENSSVWWARPEWYKGPSNT